MIALQITFTDDEVRRFLEANGCRVEQRDFGEWVKQYHNKTTYEKHAELAVVDNSGQYVPARKLFEKHAERRIKRLLMPDNLETRRSISKLLKQLLKSR